MLFAFFVIAFCNVWFGLLFFSLVFCLKCLFFVCFDALFVIVVFARYFWCCCMFRFVFCCVCLCLCVLCVLCICVFVFYFCFVVVSLFCVCLLCCLHNVFCL